MKQLALDIGLDSHQSLASFHPGANALALQAVREWCEGGPAAAAPLYLWGAPGSGKTHLLHAVHAILREQGARIGWMDADLLHPPPFDDGWRAVLMDDVDRFDAHQQHMAFNWFVNALTPAEGPPRAVLACGALPPADLPLRDDLRSRLGWGQIHQLHPLDDAARHEVLRGEAQARGLRMSPEVADFMLTRFSRDLGSLMALLAELDRYGLQTQRAITIPLIKAMLENE